MRVLLVVHGYPPAASGGTEIYTQQLADALSELSGLEVFVLTRDCDSSRPEVQPPTGSDGHRRNRLPHQQHFPGLLLVRGQLCQSGAGERGRTHHRPGDRSGRHPHPAPDLLIDGDCEARVCGQTAGGDDAERLLAPLSSRSIAAPGWYALRRTVRRRLRELRTGGRPGRSNRLSGRQTRPNASASWSRRVCPDRVRLAGAPHIDTTTVCRLRSAARAHARHLQRHRSVPRTVRNHGSVGGTAADRMLAAVPLRPGHRPAAIRAGNPPAVGYPPTRVRRQLDTVQSTPRPPRSSGHLAAWSRNRGPARSACRLPRRSTLFRPSGAAAGAAVHPQAGTHSSRADGGGVERCRRARRSLRVDRKRSVRDP